jgi:hypothetical protein
MCAIVGPGNSARSAMQSLLKIIRIFSVVPCLPKSTDFVQQHAGPKPWLACPEQQRIRRASRHTMLRVGIQADRLAQKVYPLVDLQTLEVDHALIHCLMVHNCLPKGPLDPS